MRVGKARRWRREVGRVSSDCADGELLRVAGLAWFTPTHSDDGAVGMDGAPELFGDDEGLRSCADGEGLCVAGDIDVEAASDSARSLKMVQRMRRVQREVSLAPHGVLPPRDS